MNENLFDKLKELSGETPSKLNILEEQIDITLQLEYFKLSNKIKKQLKKDDHKLILDEVTDIYTPELTNEARKEILVKLASVDDVKAYRIIEQYVTEKHADIHDWAVLAFQESKMLLESNLLNENQIFISTGLGGRGNMLRYFVVLVGHEVEAFEEFHQKIIKSEFKFALQKNESELEMINFQENFATLKVLIPFKIQFQQVFKTAVEECNQFGNFLENNFLVTNVKELSLDEIKDFIKKNDLPNNNESNIDLDPIINEDDE